MKYRSRLSRIAGKAAHLLVKVVLVRTFGIEGAACVLAGIVAMRDRLKGILPELRRAADAVWPTLCNAAATVRRLIQDRKKNAARPEAGGK